MDSADISAEDMEAKRRDEAAYRRQKMAGNQRYLKLMRDRIAGEVTGNHPNRSSAVALAGDLSEEELLELAMGCQVVIEHWHSVQLVYRELYAIKSGRTVPKLTEERQIIWGT